MANGHILQELLCSFFEEEEEEEGGKAALAKRPDLLFQPNSFCQSQSQRPDLQRI